MTKRRIYQNDSSFSQISAFFQGLLLETVIVSMRIVVTSELVKQRGKTKPDATVIVNVSLMEQSFVLKIHLSNNANKSETNRY